MKASCKQNEDKYNEYLIRDLSLPSVTTVASVAWRDINLDKASDVLLWVEEEHFTLTNRLISSPAFQDIDINNELNLGYLFQPAPQGDKNKEHWWCVEEGDGVDFCLLHHGNYEDDQ